MVTVQEFESDYKLDVIKNGLNKLCIVHSSSGYIYIARYREIPGGYCHYYQIAFDKNMVGYYVGLYPKYKSCDNVTREELLAYLETNFPEDMDWLLFHPELYDGRFNSDV